MEEKVYTRVGPFASGFGWLLCWLGLHRKNFSFGYMTFLDGSGQDGYHGTFSCLRCGLILGRRKTGGRE